MYIVDYRPVLILLTPTVSNMTVTSLPIKQTKKQNKQSCQSDAHSYTNAPSNFIFYINLHIQPYNIEFFTLCPL